MLLLPAQKRKSRCLVVLLAPAAMQLCIVSWPLLYLPPFPGRLFLASLPDKLLLILKGPASKSPPLRSLL